MSRYTGPTTKLSRREGQELFLKGDRSFAPCNSCNAHGMVYGKKHSEAWTEVLNFKSSKIK